MTEEQAREIAEAAAILSCEVEIGLEPVWDNLLDALQAAGYDVERSAAHSSARWERRPAMQRSGVLDIVAGERIRQDARWGEQNHSLAHWLAILTEEVGEVAQAVCKAEIPPVNPMSRMLHLAHYRAELVQVAAVAVAAIESLDRNELAER